MFFVQSEQYTSATSGQEGRPANYPYMDAHPDLLFYIQRNQNINTVIYELNMLQGGLLNLQEPIKISWVFFEENSQVKVDELNLIQKKLAYGYHHKVISNDLIEFRFVSYSDMTFFLAKNNCGVFRVVSKFKGEFVEIDHIYVYSEDFGVFPQVKFVEFFGKNDAGPFYSRLVLE
ncbi:MAG: DUF4833 domain-containing protein [Saprospiraceae bacterium]|jgi:hypothetical protein|nr:DUF4833 domain-containing protein [Saprospiraceae bacterium]MBP6446045.1 DUF4833 domain-containing protein [Saprospiraceae bacterium]